MEIGKLHKREITEEMRESYLDYAMSVIVSRALPDVRDGLKPVHRRILYAMHEMGLRHSAKFVKSARIVGNTMAYYHPHGDLALYEALVRLAQPFSLRYPLVQGQGNFGSIDGDSPAAQRYTEARLTPIAEELLVDIEKDTVDFQPNYDATRQEPKVLPSKIPNLLLNGSMGIAVGMATNIPPHNLHEVVEALKYLLRTPSANTEELMQFIKGPDFPTGGIIYDKNAILSVYANGRGAIVARGKAEVVERKKTGFDIVITELPYEVNKAELIRKVAELAEEKRVVGIRDIRDESDKEGLRVVIELKNDAQPERVLNQLYKLTDLEKAFHVNVLALLDGLQPQTLSLQALLQEYLEHRQKVITRRTTFDLKRTNERIHILEGLAKALAKIDEVIKTIKTSESREDAKKNLVTKFVLSELQADAILEMRLESLARLEREKILEELSEKKKLAKELEGILRSPKRITAVIEGELDYLDKKFGDARRTRVEPHPLGEVREEELIQEEEIVITLSQANYIKRMNPDAFRLQRRGGKGVIGFTASNASKRGQEASQDEDSLRLVTAANTHDIVLLFSNLGRVFQVRAYEIPEGSRVARGKPIQSLLNVLPGEEVVAIVSYQEEKTATKHQFLILVTKNGIAKKTPLKDFRNVRKSGMRAVSLKKGDALRWASLSSGEDEVLLVSARGQAIRFQEKDTRAMGRISAGVTVLRLKGNDEVVGMGVIRRKREAGEKDAKVLVVTQRGFGKLTPLSAYRLQKRGGIGIKTASLDETTGPIIAARIIRGEEELIAVSEKGQTIRTPLTSIRTQGRATKGVRIMKLASGDALVAVTCT